MDTKNVMVTQFILPNGVKKNGCGRKSVVLGFGDSAVVEFESVCFGSQEQLDSMERPGEIMLFQDFKNFSGRNFPGGFLGFRGVKLSGKVTKLEGLSKSDRADLFKPLFRNDGYLNSVKLDSKQLQVLCASLSHLSWPRVHSGEVQGHVVLYLSTDKTGRVQEVFPASADNSEISDFVTGQASEWSIPPITDPSGGPVQMEGFLSLPFQTSLADPSPK